MTLDTSGLYALVDNEFDSMAPIIRDCMNASIEKNRFDNELAPTNSDTPRLTGQAVFQALTTLLFEYVAQSPKKTEYSMQHRYITRYKHAVTKQELTLPGLASDLEAWFEAWAHGVLASPPTFHEFGIGSGSDYPYLIPRLRRQIKNVLEIVDRNMPSTARAREGKRKDLSLDSRTWTAHFTYEGPGLHRKDGPRHDNDHAEIRDIEIHPSHLELICPIPPCLPGTVREMPHHLPLESMDRLLDVQFRLLREELV